MHLSWETLTHLADAFAVLAVGLPILRKLFRIADLLEEYPLHRHVNGKVVYPKGFAPETIQSLDIKH